MPYTAQTWTNYDPTTPLTGTRLTTLEQGVQNASQVQLYFKTATATPSATLNTFGTQVTFTPPVGATVFMPLHVGISTQGTFNAETLSVRCQGGFSDSTTAGTSSNYTSVTGDIDPQNLLYGLTGASNGNTGQTISGKVLTSVIFDCKSTINSSLTSVICRFWAVAYA